LSVGQQIVDEGGPKVPGYIVTYSDMVTLLLTFFVMLLSLAEKQDPELVSSGRDSFVQSMRGFGLGMLFGKEQTFDSGAIKLRHPVENPQDTPDKVLIDAQEEQLRQLFEEVEKVMSIKTSQLVATNTSPTITNIHFSSDTSELDESAKNYLVEFCCELQSSAGPHERKLYVLGLAPDVKNQKQQWLLSAKRAQAVADFVRDMLPSALHWPVYSWGAGPGGDWISKDSVASKDQQILIAVLRTTE
jgi:outer membrane protein OmpA-like peptidoglycan-associated protein